MTTTEQAKITDQPPPQPNDGQPIWRLVIADMEERDRIGRERYGTPLQAHNGRDALVDAYQESLDLAVYLRQEIAERETAAARLEALRKFVYRIAFGTGLPGDRPLAGGVSLQARQLLIDQGFIEETAS